MKNHPKRRILSLLLTLLTLTLALPIQAAGLGSVVSTDIVAFIEGAAIPSYSYKDVTMVVAEDLMKYGFDVTYDNSERALRIYSNPSKPLSADYTPERSTLPIGTPLMRVRESDIKTYVEGRLVTSYNVGGFTVISLDELGFYYDCDYVWNPSARTLSLELHDEVSTPEPTVEPTVEPTPEPTPEPTVDTPAVELDWKAQLLEAVADAVARRLPSLELEIPTDDIDTVNKLLAIYDNNPSAWTHFAYVSRYWNARPLTRITVTISYIADETTAAKVTALADGIAEEARGLPTDYERVLFVHDAICELTEYDHDYVAAGKLDYRAPQQHITGVLLYGKAVCQGYAETMEFIMNRLGIECVTVSGYSNGQPHSWNVVYLGGEGYFVDVTWDDSGEEIGYNYFMRTTAQMQGTHTLQSHTLPEFTDESLGWYRVNGLYFDSVDLTVIEPLIVEAMRRAENLELEFETPALAKEFHERIFKNDYVFGLLKKAGRQNQLIWYVTDAASPFYELCFSELT